MRVLYWLLLAGVFRITIDPTVVGQFDEKIIRGCWSFSLSFQTNPKKYCFHLEIFIEYPSSKPPFFIGIFQLHDDGFGVRTADLHEATEAEQFDALQRKILDGGLGLCHKGGFV